MPVVISPCGDSFAVTAMAEMSALARYKSLHHNKGYSIVSKYEDGSEATVVLRGEDSEVKITDNSAEFVDAVDNIVESIRKGEKSLIDLESTPARRKDVFLTNKRWFETASENPAENAIERINQGDAHPPEDIDFEKGLEASLNLDMQDEDLQKIVRNYPEALGIRLSNKHKHSILINKFKNNNAYNLDEFDSWLRDTLSILNNAHSKKSSLETYKSVSEQRTDFEFLSRLWLDEKETNVQFWNAIRRSLPVDEDPESIVRYRELERADGTHSDETATIPVKTAIKRILKQYASLYELSKEPLHDIAVALNVPTSVNTDNHGEILNFLDNNGEQNFTYPIVRELRNGPSHSSVEIDEDEQVVRIYNNRRKNRTVQRRVIFEEIPNYYYAISDMLLALVNGIIQHHERIQFEYLNSEDFQSRIMENAKKGTFRKQ